MVSTGDSRLSIGQQHLLLAPADLLDFSHPEDWLARSKPARACHNQTGSHHEGIEG